MGTALVLVTAPDYNLPRRKLNRNVIFCVTFIE
jgi:hypothetical protein